MPKFKWIDLPVPPPPPPPALVNLLDNQLESLFDDDNFDDFVEAAHVLSQTLQLCLNCRTDLEKNYRSFS